MARRRLTIKRLDPWSVLKFGAVANVVLFAILMLVAGVVWYIIDQLQLVDQACGIATDVGFTSCGINAGNLFRALALLGGMGVIVQTAIWVFGAFLYNLIADLTGGLVISTVEEGGPARAAATSQARPVTASSPPVVPSVRDRTGGRDRATGGARSATAQPGRARASADDTQATRAQQPVGGRERGDGEDLFTDG